MDCYITRTGGYLPGEAINNEDISTFIGKLEGEAHLPELLHDRVRIARDPVVFERFGVVPQLGAGRVGRHFGGNARRVQLALPVGRGPGRERVLDELRDVVVRRGARFGARKAATGLQFVLAERPAERLPVRVRRERQAQPARLRRVEAHTG